MEALATLTGATAANPHADLGTLLGTVGPGGFVGEGFVAEGFVGAAPQPPHTLVGTVGRTLVDSYEAQVAACAVRVKIAGEWVPQSELVGPVTLRESLDSVSSPVRFGLVGSRWSTLRTEQTWTRTPVEIWTWQGPVDVAGGIVQERRLVGVIQTAEREEATRGTVLRVTADNLSVLYDRVRLCHELPPYQGLTRGQIVREVAADLGLSAAQVDVPEGEVYNAPLQLDGERWPAWLEEWGEPEGWYWRWADDVLQAYTAAIQPAPQAADHTWGPDRIQSVDVRPPQDVPSRWVLHGTRAIYVDEVGVESEVTTTEVRAPYAPVVATEQQQSDGSVVATGYSPGAESERTILRLVETVRRLGNRVLSQETVEHGWYNAAAGHLVRVAGAGTAGDGYDYLVVYLADGEPVQWHRQRFVEVGRRLEVPTYDAEDRETATRVTTHRWRRRTMGVEQTPADGAGADTGSMVGGDGQSYYHPPGTGDVGIEDYGRAEESLIQRTYSGGAAHTEDQDDYEYYSLRAPRDVAGHHLLYDGTAQVDLVAPWTRVRRRSRVNHLTSDRRLSGVTEIETGYRALERAVDGAHDYGSHRSDEPTERWRALETRHIAYRVVGHDQVEEVTYDADGRHSRIILGGLPMPRFALSAWTRLVSEPLMLVIDDPVLQAWFGVSSETIDNPYVQSQAQALAVYEQRRARQLAHRVTIRRPEALARPGDTVYVQWPGLHRRLLLVERDVTIQLPSGLALGTYVLEAPV